MMTPYSLQDENFAEGELPVENPEKSRMNEADIPQPLGILPLKNMVLFPGGVSPITVGRDKSIQLVKDAYNTEHKLVGVLAQKHTEIEDPGFDDLHQIGTLARILRLIRMPDGSITILIQGREKFEVTEFVTADPYFMAQTRRVEDVYPAREKVRALMHSLKEKANDVIDLSPNLPSEAKIAVENIDSLGYLVNFIASNLNIDVAEKQEILERQALASKAELVLGHMNRELQVLELSEEIQTKVKRDLDDQQREYILRQQIKAIQDELGDDADGDIEGLRSRAAAKSWPAEVAAVFEKELGRLSRLTPAMPDFAVTANYLDWLLELPWLEYAEERYDLHMAQEVLDEDHYGLEKVKERILEQLAVLKLKANKKAPILCFYGPPGVGKTSLGKSIARAMEREFIRISLGGLHDEAEIRGHRRTYIGAMPGRIIQGLKRVKTSNPVFVLDEIDKVGSDFRGDPASALLEVLDPEQNSTFRDNYLEVEYDLSQVMFIATANSLSSIHPALLDRMEVIEINSYSQEEKVEIAKRHLVPHSREEHGLKARQLNLTPKAIAAIVSNYTREAGVRQLNQKINAICRAVAREVVMNNKEQVRITDKNLQKFLGIERYENERYMMVDSPGVAVGLAWTPVGGDILFIEATLTRGNGKLSSTGQLGNVMKESATLAFTYLRANAERLGIPHEAFKYWDVHVHVPAGAIPKDGPSAGITLMTAITSLFTQRNVRANLAMTGEITLRGKVLPVGGIKEKLLAAVRAGIHTVILCKENEKDVSEIKQDYLQGLTIIYVTRMEEVLRHALEPRAVAKPLNLLPADAPAQPQVAAAPAEAVWEES